VRAVAPVIRAQRAPERRDDVAPSNVALPSVAAPVGVSGAAVGAPVNHAAVIESYMLALGMI
jgi:hypothetical protein